MGIGQNIERQNIDMTKYRKTKYRLGLYIEKNINAESWHRQIQLDTRKHLTVPKVTIYSLYNFEFDIFWFLHFFSSVWLLTNKITLLASFSDLNAKQQT
ncbi:hypothetical protein BpHYR1_000472 [Brachionus plicatilis]|uniref:Uncharacterized protein n=1 Tax=Brachionus plicatilis TaxID=10195 RepID=A0A3M7RN94_BRAPC|nr:hypothetical protein BpHYR1_000472 [Brachionus plicatilis]